MVAVSVLLPVYNGERYLRDAVGSVLSQGFTDFELLLLDDGSTDRSLEIMQGFANGDSRVRVISRENRGLVATLNQLVGEARGELLARMDADDICLPDRLQRQVDFLAAHPEVVCVGGDVELIDDAGRFLTVLRMVHDDASIQGQALEGHTTICHPCALMRRSAVQAVGGYHAEFYPTEDLDLWLRLGEVGQLANLSGPVLRYRLHGSSISGSDAVKQRAAARRSCEDAWRRRRLSGRSFEANAPWRPTADRRSQHQFMLRYGWWAFNSAQRHTSIIYGLRAVRLQPFASQGWRLLACALFKRMGGRAPTKGVA
jgi:glycosyltransferase involved in cell wall biosynthesis